MDVPAPSAAAPERVGSDARARLAAAAVRLLARWTPYLEAEMLGLPALVGPGSVCLDVGSAAGLYTMALSSLVGPTGRVLSVEPLTFAHHFWTRLLRSREGKNVRYFPVALGAEPGSGLMSVPIGRYGLVTGRSFLARRASGQGSNAEFAGQIDIAVKVETLDDLCQRAGLERLDFVKIDVEGAELQVLEGGRTTLERHHPAMLIEVEARHSARFGCGPGEIVEWLTKRGYRMHVWQAGTWQPASAITPSTRNYLFLEEGAEPRR